MLGEKGREIGAILRELCKWYYVDTVGKNTKAIKEYIAGQLEEDKLGEQLRIDYPESPFK